MFNLNLFNVFCTIITLLVIRIIFKFIIRPFLEVWYYQKQGFIAYYFPLIGYIKCSLEGVNNHGDSMHQLKTYVKNKPNLLGGVSILGTRALIKLAHPELIKIFSQTQNENYIKCQFFLNIFKRSASEGLVFVEGNVHKKLRKLISNSFHFEFLKQNICTVLNITKGNLHKLENEHGLKSIDIMEEMEVILGDSVSEIFFGYIDKNLKYKGMRMSSAGANLLARITMTTFSVPYILLGDYFFSLGILKEHRELLEDMKNLRQISKNIILQKKTVIQSNMATNSTNDKSLIAMLIKEQINSPLDCLNDDEITDQFSTFFGAGTDTTGHLITMSLYHLIKNPSYIVKIQQEINENMEDLDNMTYEQLGSLKTLNAVIREVLRLSSPSQEIFIREAIKDHYIGKIKVKKGTLVNVSLTANCYSNSNFNNFSQFDPMRWLDNGEGTKLKDAFTYIPFFAGSRNCIGQHLANLETKIIIVYILKRYNIKLSNPNYQLKMTSRFLYEPYDRILLDFEIIN